MGLHSAQQFAPDSGYYVVSKSTQTGAAINGGIANAVATGKKHLVIPGGVTWVLGAGGQIVIPAEITRVTMEDGSVLLGPNGPYSGVVVGRTSLYAAIGGAALPDITLENVSIDHQTNGTAGNGILFVPTSVVANDYQGTPCSRVTVEACDVAGYNAHEYLVWVVQGQYVKILDNYIRGYGATATDEVGIELAGGLDVLVQGNTVRDCGQVGINLPDIVANNSRTSVRIVDNYVDTADYGISVNNGGSIDVNANITDLVVDRNQIRNTRTRGVSFTTGAGVTVDDVKITRNQIRNPAGTGIALIGNATTVSNGIDINDNHIVNTTASTATDAAITLNNFPNVRVDRNRIRTSAAHGIYATNSADCEVSRNRIENVQLSAIRANITARLVAQGNIIHGYNLSATAQPAIQVDSSFDPKIESNKFDVGTGTSNYAVYITAGCVRGVERNNDILGLPATAAPTRNDGSNPNKFTFVAPNDGATKTFTGANSLLRSFMTLVVQQEGGTPQPFTVTTASAAYTVTWPNPPTGETYRVEILP